MRIGTRLGRHSWISMGPLGWLIYAAIVLPIAVPLMAAGFAVKGLWWCTVLMVRGVAWCVRRAARRREIPAWALESLRRTR